MRGLIFKFLKEKLIKKIVALIVSSSWSMPSFATFHQMIPIANFKLKETMAVIPEMTWHLPMRLINKISKKHDIDRDWFAALVYQESRGMPYAIRYEPNFKWLYFERHFAEMHNISLETEIILQKTSFGYGQIMGATARSECAYKGRLQELVKDHELSLDLAAQYLKKQLEKYGVYRKAIAAYNAGSVRYKHDSINFINQRYVDSVFQYYKELSKLEE